MKLSLFLILTVTFNVCLASQNDLVISPESKVEIFVNTSEASQGGQSLTLKVISENKVEELHFQASTGNFEAPTSDYKGQLTDQQAYAQWHKHVLFYKDDQAIQAIELSRLYSIPKGKLSGEECLNQQMQCSPAGNISLWPEDARFLFDLISIIGLKNTTIVINDTGK